MKGHLLTSKKIERFRDYEYSGVKSITCPA